MKRKLILLVMVLNVIVMLSSATISGRITDSRGVALSDSDVKLHIEMNPTSNPNDHTNHDMIMDESDTNGNFTFSSVEPGSYRIMASKPGYMESPYLDPVTGQVRVIEIDADDQEVEGVNIVLVRILEPPHDGRVNVSGIVKGTDNQPLSGITVGIALAAEPDSIIPFHFGASDAQGHYMIPNLQTNQAYVAKAIDNFTMVSISEDVEFTTPEEDGTVENINIILPFQGYSISGTVTNQQGSPIPGAYVVLYNIVPNVTNSIYLWIGTFADQNGHYILQHILPGSYNMALEQHFMPTVFYPSTMNHSSAGVVTVLDSDVTGINIQVPTPQLYTLSGTVTDVATNLALANIHVRIDNPGMGHHEGPCDPVTNQNDDQDAISDASGHWSLTVMEGDYVLVAYDPTHAYRTQFYDGANTPFDATHLIVNQDTANLNFNLEANTETESGSITGVVTDNGSFPTYPVMVIAVSSDEDWEDVAIADPNGQYRISHVNPGNYYVIATSASAPPTYFQNSITWEAADLVTVTGSVTGIDIQLTHTSLSGPNTMTGTVIGSSGLPIANATVALQDDLGSTISYATTDQNGSYDVSSIASQTYHVVVCKLGVPSLSTNIPVSGVTNHDFVMNTPTANEDPVTTPATVSLNASVYPNPFNPQTTISYNLSKASQVSVEIFNLKGQKIKSFQMGTMNSGLQKLTWNGTDNTGKPVSSGIYFCQVNSETGSSLLKMALLK